MTFGKGSGRIPPPLLSGWGNIMKTLVLALVLGVLSTGAALAGNCTYSTDQAADGSRCGGRASTERPGGK